MPPLLIEDDSAGAGSALIKSENVWLHIVAFILYVDFSIFLYSNSCIVLLSEAVRCHQLHLVYGSRQFHPEEMICFIGLGKAARFRQIGALVQRHSYRVHAFELLRFQAAAIIGSGGYLPLGIIVPDIHDDFFFRIGLTNGGA